jgi:hypothetical protein
MKTGPAVVFEFYYWDGQLFDGQPALQRPKGYHWRREARQDLEGKTVDDPFKSQEAAHKAAEDEAEKLGFGEGELRYIH